ncbi:hypothetical protein P3T35_004095 [Kitasatospora sp. GP30]|uniref:alkaline phosphatase family protein n=1 Tax=Kitasatospora sp. GP30 TaxID=3035084 RepID=UPI000C70185B|nr:alkaline phosphatase family protein [Kitasatospora sp. GP30]MDH6142074.1 hypothetical protein [Kitasatospora sp. GP30]
MTTLPRRALTALAAAALTALTAGAGCAQATPAGHPTTAGLPTPDHVIVVVLENHGYSQIIGSSSAPYLNGTLKAGGANLTNSYAITHPSEPNYYALFSGSTQGRTDDSCIGVQSLTAPSLGSELLAAGKSWLSYNESLPSQGSTACSSGEYAQKHNPWFGFANVPLNTADTFAQFPTDYTKLPKESFVIPNLCDDMHDCSIKTSDSWVKNHLGAYASWAQTHNSLLVVTFDEDDSTTSANHIPTLVYGQHVIPGSSATATYNHYGVLRTLEDLAGLTSHAGNAATASDITGIWN